MRFHKLIYKFLLLTSKKLFTKILV